MVALVSARAERSRVLESAPVVLSAIAGYLAVHYVLRLALGGSLGFDDAEQALFAQTFAWSYRTVQPPLYTWLLVGVYDTLGVNLATTVLPRYLLLGVTFVAMYLVACRWIRDRTLAALAVFSYALIYVFAYYAHHDLTHTTALGAGVALTFLILSQIAATPDRTLPYALLGLAMAIGVLGKWNFVTLAVGLPVACLLHPNYRRFVLSPRSLLTIAVLAAAVAPTGWQMIGGGATPGTVAEAVLIDPGVAGAQLPIVTGSLALAGAAALFPMPFLVVFAALFARAAWRGRECLRPAVSGAPEDGRVGPDFLLLLALVVLLLHWLLIPVTGADAFTARWMHPALMILPIAAFQLVDCGRSDGRAIRAYLLVVLAALVVVLGVRTVRHALGADHCGKCREMAPFGELAEQIRALGFGRGTIVADGYHVAGNMRLAFPDSRVLEPGSRKSVFPERGPGGACLAVWLHVPGEAGADRPPMAHYLDGALRIADTAPFQRGIVGATMSGSSSRMYRLGYAYLAGGAGACR